MDFIFSASIIASFFAGMVALFAPCCITVLLPAYLGSTFRAKNNILRMTFVFFAGIALILIPIGLGAAGLAKVFQSFHKELYIVGGTLMLLLAILAVLGKGLSFIPMPRKAMRQTGSDAKSVFLLGIFSGAATSCCAPVLAGAVTLAVISGVFWKALIVVFAYVFGMTFPLFIAAYFYDKFQLDKSRIIKGTVWNIKVADRSFFIHSTNLFSGILFFAIGITLLMLAFTGNAFWAPSFQAEIGTSLAQWSQDLLRIFAKIPDIVWGFLILGIFSFFLLRAKKN
ncbi:MAG: cytochrome c biogenesis protein CcdA [Candidatus Wildermuthbacteria bacterium]|nr:cytochrome c biogenesis protein CcdA [Candidatus Wildermuthbacteria bacterium]